MENNNYNSFSHKNIISVNELAHSGGLTIRETSKTTFVYRGDITSQYFCSAGHIRLG